MSVVVPHTRFLAARARRKAREEQAFIEACERELDEGRPQNMGELIDRAKERVEKERER